LRAPHARWLVEIITDYSISVGGNHRSAEAVPSLFRADDRLVYEAELAGGLRSRVLSDGLSPFSSAACA